MLLIRSSITYRLKHVEAAVAASRLAILDGMGDGHDYQTARSRPLQARGKERVRKILSAALTLFAEKGLVEVTTNDIAKAAGIPIGSLYRYYPNKEAIINALTDSFTRDLRHIFDNMARHPLLRRLSWHEVCFMAVDAWVTYVRLSGPFAFLYAEQANPRLLNQNKAAWQALQDSFGTIIHERCPLVSQKERLVCFRLAMDAVEMGVNKAYWAVGGDTLHTDIAAIIALYLERVCRAHNHDHSATASAQ